MSFKTYRTLDEVNHTVGIWLNITDDSNLTVAGVVPALTAMQLHRGWNLVGYPSTNPSFTVLGLRASAPVGRVEGFDPSAPPNFLRILQESDSLSAGFGYWFWAWTDGIWTVSFA